MFSMRGIRKEFPGVMAVDGVDFSANKGEVMGLLGENGAGKSTLMGLLYGVYRLDAGTIEVEGKEISIRNSGDAIKLGLGMVHQAFTLVPNLTIAENIILGSEPTKAGIIDIKRANQEVKELMARSGLSLDPELLVEDLPTGFKQRVEILKALYRGARVLILDEPTAVLTPLESVELFKSVKRLAESGSTVVLITHKLKEVLAVTNRITVMRRGKVVGTIDTKDASVGKLADLMVGRLIQRNFVFKDRQPGNVILDVNNITVRGRYKPKAIEGCTFQVREGEIVGIAGVEGNGQTELVGAVMGMLKLSAGSITIKGVSTSKFSTKKIMGLSVAHVPEDRALSGLVLDFSIAENSVLGKVDDRLYSARGFMLIRKVNEFARRIVSLFNVSAPSVSVRARNLSGGNQQKVIVGRELSNEPNLLIAHQPTRGLDVASTEYIQSLLVEARNAGRGVLLVSADFDEILDLSDRILVLYEGKIIGESERGISIAELGKMLGGVAIQ
jgi:general nucleoside transport system ATP-binding protein